MLNIPNIPKMMKARSILNNNEFLRKLNKQKMFMLFLLPGVLYFIVFSYIPLYGLIGAFQEYDPIVGFFRSKFIGLENFKVLFSLPDFLIVLKNTLLISFWNLIFGFPAPIILALLFNEVFNLRFKKFVQTISYIPNFISWVVAAGIWYKLLAADGVVNDLLHVFNISTDPVYFMSTKGFFIPILVLSSIWKNVGFGTILYLAVLTSINPELYESAQIDGATKLKQIRYITLPGIMPTIMLLLVLAVSNILNVNFDQIYTLQNPQVYEVGEVLDTYIFKIAMYGQLSDYSRGMAVGLFRAVVCIILFFSANGFSKRIGTGSVY